MCPQSWAHCIIYSYSKLQSANPCRRIAAIKHDIISLGLENVVNVASLANLTNISSVNLIVYNTSKGSNRSLYTINGVLICAISSSAKNIISVPFCSRIDGSYGGICSVFQTSNRNICSIYGNVAVCGASRDIGLLKRRISLTKRGLNSSNKFLFGNSTIIDSCGQNEVVANRSGNNTICRSTASNIFNKAINIDIELVAGSVGVVPLLINITSNLIIWLL